MSKWIELAKLLPKGIANIDKVAAGTINDLRTKGFGWMGQEKLEEITKRRLICSGCEYNSKNAIAAGTYTTDREDDHCTHCECNLAWLTASLNEQCGIHEYNEKNPDNPMPLKWDSYNPNEHNEEVKS